MLKTLNVIVSFCEAYYKHFTNILHFYVCTCKIVKECNWQSRYDDLENMLLTSYMKLNHLKVHKKERYQL